jgi:hypothetical protein
MSHTFKIKLLVVLLTVILFWGFDWVVFKSGISLNTTLTALCCILPITLLVKIPKKKND